MVKILIVEDDEPLAQLVQEYLQAKGFDAHIEYRGDTAPDRIAELKPDLVILDIMLPGMNGLDVCRQIRPTYHGAVLMLTALDDEIDEVVGLEIGADDYVAKPVKPRLLVARINALLRRATPSAGGDASSGGVLCVGSLRLDMGTREVHVEGRLLDLTTAEFDLLGYLMERAGRIVDREQIYQDLRGIAYDGIDRSIDLRVARLRKKIGDDGKSPTIIKSIRGVGYLLAANDG